jgi:DNA-binding PadR family transcriptional regulator
MLLAVLHLAASRHEAYGSSIREAIEQRSGREVPRGSVYVTLDRLEEKGLLSSVERRGDADRGDRPKRLFRVTPAGLRAVRASAGAVVRMQRGLESVLGRL